MLSSLSVVACLIGALISFPADDDEARQRQLAALLEGFETWMQDGDYADKAARSAFIDENLGDLALDQLSPRELRPLIWFSRGTAHYERVTRRLHEFDEDSGVDGAIARAEFAYRGINSSDSDQQRDELMLAAYTHPAFADALRTGQPVTNIYQYDPPWRLLVYSPLMLDQSMQTLDPALVRMMRALCDANDPQFSSRVHHLAFRLSLLSDRLSESALQSASTRVNEYADAIAAHSPDDARTAESIRQVAFTIAVPRLVGKPTPELDIIWDSGHREWRHLEDLRGNVVFIDFWATDCAPCIGEFPEVRELQDHYRGFDVIILGVTGLQGYVVDPDEGLIVCRDDPEREIELMEEIITKLDMTWPVAITKQPSINPEFGFAAIPYKVLIDPEGVVRAVRLESQSVTIDGEVRPRFTQVMEEIDALLKEAGLRVPKVADSP